MFYPFFSVFLRVVCGLLIRLLLPSTTYKLSKCLKKRFGIIPNITDHDYITNSYHVNVREEINAEDKLKFESQFQNISSGGSISYVETCNLLK
jgi:ribonucleoside-triphosphate reductase